MSLDAKPAAATISVVIVKMTIIPKLIMANVSANSSSKNPIATESANLALLLAVLPAKQAMIIIALNVLTPMLHFKVENVSVLPDSSTSTKKATAIHVMW